MRILAILVNYNGKDIIGRAIESVQRQLVQDIAEEVTQKIIVMDNASTDGSVEFLHEKYPDVFIMKSEKNLGFGVPINVATALVKEIRDEYDYILLLNSDAVLDEHWLLYALEPMTDETVFAVNGKTFLMHESHIQNAGSAIFGAGYGRDRGAVVEDQRQKYESDMGQYDSACSVQAFCGVAVLLRLNVFEKLDGFDPSFFLYYEDTDLSVRAQKAGYRIQYEPRAIAYHEHAKTSSENSPFFLYHSKRSRLIFLLKHFSWSVCFRELAMYKLRALYSVFYRPLVRFLAIKVLFSLVPELLSILKYRLSQSSDEKRRWVQIEKEMY
ncbi:MAG: Glycosyl transferase family 2 [Microgenomates group bacterium GW2011_GWF2_45_18]|nr:MAG: Glycosyl transferase family 2 [Microgenomates group bacterium GW2011_GWF1_44_10]KKU02320.1 MAG: Glycosyl transferase family 2 [Microgenomates group bacterium GW2011_GWF2_45_18]OGJ41655.1 MAG: hypothetical protein A2378_02100 [Candidatus Pacebacteria bacterium RIFOXYB1_FULL_44_10]HAU99214.1 hypothetical protein [Candidatus Paceibacterota bacterium]HAX01745.1 hypothetical protein [Candidatus Paceibacterota bacterium]